MFNQEKISEYIMENGKQYLPALAPEGLVTTGKVGDCYDQSVLNAMTGKWRYVEGLALNPQDKNNWILHAWVTDGIHAYDPTWKATTPSGKQIPVPTVYFGIEMDIRKVMLFMQATEYHGIFANAWRDPQKAKQIIKDIPI